MRPAVATDCRAIRRIVIAARLNPLDLDWRRFLVAERAGRIVGSIRVRRYADGTRELASLAVVAGEQSGGIGATLIGALLMRESSTLYLFCAAGLAGYYERFGFYPIALRDLPPGLRAYGRIARAIVRVARVSRLTVPRPVSMRLPAPACEDHRRRSVDDSDGVQHRAL